jgi:uncharacterized circularly permuted ATP-grasp superfamily protein
MLVMLRVRVVEGKDLAVDGFQVSARHKLFEGFGFARVLLHRLRNAPLDPQTFQPVREIAPITH